MDFGRPIREAATLDDACVSDHIDSIGEPVVLRALAANWPAVHAARSGSIGAYLKRLDHGAACEVLTGAPEIGGRFFYNQGMRGFNFTRAPSTFSSVVAQIEAAAEAAANGMPFSSIAAQAAAAAQALPGFADENPAPSAVAGAVPRLWLNNRVTVAAHHDASRNLAVVVAGRRRFTVFAPEMADNLYLGPLEFSPAGTPISLVDFARPDLTRYPRFATAMQQAQVAVLEPGDALYIPYMWWHHVESLDAVNLLANYWWNETPPAQPGLSLVDLIVHARLAMTAASPEQRRAWRAQLTHAMRDEVLPAEVPADRGGILGPIGDSARQSLRKQLGVLLCRP